MLRLLSLLIAQMLLFQLSWAGIGAYCQHEATARAAQHFGHHSHKHEKQAAPAAEQAERAGSFDSDCGACHAGAQAAVMAPAPLLPAPAPTASRVARHDALDPPSAPQRTPDRPQWPRLA